MTTLRGLYHITDCQVDADGSGLLEFEEFLHLMTRQKKSKKAKAKKEKTREGRKKVPMPRPRTS